MTVQLGARSRKASRITVRVYGSLMSRNMERFLVEGGFLLIVVEDRH